MLGAVNQLDALRRCSTVVADTGDVDAIARWRPQDATTNPTLLLAAAQDARFRHIVQRDPDRMAVAFGCEILKHVPGRVSTEVDARLSFDTEGTIAKAKQLLELYAKAGVGPERVLVKVAATWEGIRAARQLERDGIRCNMTLVFSLAQAVACADAGATLLSPFVGRIYDWYRAAWRVEDIAIEEDPGVASAARIYRYCKKFGYATEVMAASFRKPEQILALAGCDLVTIAPELMEKLAQAEGEVERRLDPESARRAPLEPLALDEKCFRWLLNEDAMATEKLAEGIRRFDADLRRLEAFLAAGAREAA